MEIGHDILGMSFGSYDVYLWICSGVVLLYVLKGGLTSAIYTEVLQFFMIILGFAPVVYLGLRDVGGWHSVKNALQGVATNPAAFYLQPAGSTTRRTLGRAHGSRCWPGRPPIPWAWIGLPSFSVWGLCFRSVIGARIFSWFSAPWRPAT